jgi:hypothetical protein
MAPRVTARAFTRNGALPKIWLKPRLSVAVAVASA